MPTRASCSGTGVGTGDFQSVPVVRVLSSSHDFSCVYGVVAPFASIFSTFCPAVTLIAPGGFAGGVALAGTFCGITIGTTPVIIAPLMQWLPLGPVRPTVHNTPATSDGSIAHPRKLASVF